MAANVNDNMTPSNVTNSHPYFIRYIWYIDALNKLTPFRVTNNGYVKQKYEILFLIFEFLYYESEDACDYDYDKFKEYKQIVDKFHHAFEQFKKNY